MPDIYRDNPNLKRANVQIEFTKKQIQEYLETDTCISGIRNK